MSDDYKVLLERIKNLTDQLLNVRDDVKEHVRLDEKSKEKIEAINVLVKQLEKENEFLKEQIDTTTDWVTKIVIAAISLVITLLAAAASVIYRNIDMSILFN